jgi:hypothetical protein
VLAGRARPVPVRAKIAATKRRDSSLSDEAVAQIRASDESIRVLGERHNIDPTYAWSIRVQKQRIDYVANPYLQLQGSAA